MLSTDAAHNVHVYARNSKGELKRFGKIRATVFHPKELRAIGYVIHRPDALLMVKRKERFAAIDRIEPVEGGTCVIDAADSWDEKACKRLGVDYDSCIIWEYMPVRTESGKDVGIVRNVQFNDDDFTIEQIDISKSAVDKKLLGGLLIERAQILGYRDGAIIVRDVAEDAEESGGAAAKAGEAWAKTKHSASAGVKKAGEAINDGAYKAGEALGSVRNQANDAVKRHQEKKREAEENGEYTGVDKAANLLGKQLGRTRSMFKDFKDEFDKASRED